MAPFIPPEPFDMVIFGATGDLAMRKLLPALLHLHGTDALPDDGAVVCVGRREMSNGDYLSQAEDACRRHTSVELWDDAIWEGFAERLHYVQATLNDPASYGDLSKQLAGRESRSRAFYLATPPDLFGPVSRALQNVDLVTDKSRVVLEKPLGKDLASARYINSEVGSVFREDQIFRIDHYLGKETVQNLLVLRFANSLLEPLWSHEYIDHVQITAAETVGLEGRSSYYDHTGALRDMVQNHLLQLLCLVAMEAPLSLDADAVRDEKLKVLKGLHPIANGATSTDIVRGQYVAGASGGELVPSYADENDGTASNTETFVALRAEVRNWRWAGVPFYLRTGKRMPARCSEIVVQFKKVPHLIFPAEAGAVQANRLVIRLQPDEGIKFWMVNKMPGGGGLHLRTTPLNFSFADTFDMRSPDAYERLLIDVLRGNQTLFMRCDEVDAAWSWIEPVMQSWESANDAPKPYTAGTWGPSAAVALIERDGRTWHEDVS